MKKFDKIIIIIAVFVALISLVVFKLSLNKEYNIKYAEIYVKGDFYKKVILDKNSSKETINIETDLGENIVEIENGGIRIIESDCRDKICVEDGFKDKPGEVLVCLPHKVIIEIKGEEQSEVDEVSY
ncbi:NusG domain II-containing protein [Clostridium aestuarii]|uniref:NusG domain II-containing protein n=1 Tax=Clostridium aestuarii TaxID=338193 RepID=A0ABT4D2I7_9CLOT|nr:NusG domain II-containing protein [Clostridium aestuarii]MCY6484852.1 NusG domain II-containing protein [Clostridium aestuarii]